MGAYFLSNLLPSTDRKYSSYAQQLSITCCKAFRTSFRIINQRELDNQGSIVYGIIGEFG